MREAAAIWDRERQQWTCHAIVGENDEHRPDDRLFLWGAWGEVRLRSDELAAITAQVLSQYAGAAKVELDNMLERKGYNLRMWLADAEEITESASR